MKLFPFALSSILLVSALSACTAGLFGAGAARAEGVASVKTAGAEGADDAVKRAILNGGSPTTIYAIRAKLQKLGGTLKTHIVANRGHENPAEGSFSFFETYTGPMAGGRVQEGELFIGFFSERQGDTLQVMQNFEPGLMVELIAWDYTKRCYNFWELVGNGKTSEWHYRGDSADVLADVARINMGEASPAFGQRLRCSGCHTLGTPILKELDGPHNDWWTSARKLDLGPLKLDAAADASEAAREAAGLFARAQDASNLSAQVKQGIRRVLAARAKRDGQNLKASLRSLFATMEINLVSDALPYRERAGGNIEVPQDFFVDARLVGARQGIPVATARYAAALRQAGSRFAPDEANLDETHHAFVVPARSFVDNAVIDGLVAQGLLDEELVADVLAVDFTTPVFSRARASLLRFVPETAASAGELKAKLIAGLRQAPEDAAARELLANMTEPARTATWHRQRAVAYLQACRQAAGTDRALGDWLKLASQRRAELRAAETSRNPRGQITEPGFRVIFPVDHLEPKPGALRLDPATGTCAR